MKRALVLLAQGCEGMEVVSITDILRRAGIVTQLAGILDDVSAVRCNNGLSIMPDISIYSLPYTYYDVIVIPGGFLGVRRLGGCQRVAGLLKAQNRHSGLIGAICAGPLTFAFHNLFKGRTLTSHPFSRQELINSGYKYSTETVVIDKNLITSRGPGTVIDFSLKLVELLLGRSHAQLTAAVLLYV